MTQTAISIENLSKAFLIGVKEQTPDTLIGSVVKTIGSPIKNFQSIKRLDTNRLTQSETEIQDSDDIYWALKNVNLEIKNGDVVGILGPNGAGKSTLLKVLSRITAPTRGRIEIHGRVGSLLEVGTGFHPELTGRENIYMNGTILGMKKREIDSKLDEIIDFSGVEKFLDTPTKRWSSGMRVRLAFAVAANLDPEILIVDEVLAVGDVGFQQKCLGKMQDVSSQGRTVLFVSHNMAAISLLCNSAILLENGQVISAGKTDELIDQHFDQQLGIAGKSSLAEREDREGSGEVIISSITMKGTNSERENFFRTGDDVQLIVKIEKRHADARPNRLRISCCNKSGTKIWDMDTSEDLARSTIEGFEQQADFVLPRINLPRGEYVLNAELNCGNDTYDRVSNALSIHVVDGDYYRSNRPSQARGGATLLDYALNEVK